MKNHKIILAVKRRHLVNYGDACDVRKSYCLQNSVCIDSICQCRTGELFSKYGLCQPLEELAKDISSKDSFFAWVNFNRRCVVLKFH